MVSFKDQCTQLASLHGALPGIHWQHSRLNLQQCRKGLDAGCKVPKAIASLFRGLLFPTCWQKHPSSLHDARRRSQQRVASCGRQRLGS
jgi:hypothetical protein